MPMVSASSLSVLWLFEKSSGVVLVVSLVGLERTFRRLCVVKYFLWVVESRCWLRILFYFTLLYFNFCFVSVWVLCVEAADYLCVDLSTCSHRSASTWLLSLFSFFM